MFAKNESKYTSDKLNALEGVQTYDLSVKLVPSVLHPKEHFDVDFIASLGVFKIT